METEIQTSHREGAGRGDEKGVDSKENHRLVAVKVIRKKGLSALVEWEERKYIKRAFVPVKALDGDQCPAAELEHGIQHGEAWEECMGKPPTPKQMADALRRAGIWTMEDLFNNPIKAKKIFQSLHGQQFVHFFRATRGGKK